MKAIILVMLIVQAAALRATAITVVTVPARPGAARSGRPSPIALVVVSGASWNIGNNHLGQPGADILIYGAPLLLGMGIMAGLLLIRHRRGLDRLD